MRLADQLAIEWEGEDIQVVGVIATMPQPYERSLRFEFDIERVLTPHAVVPGHVAISWWGTPERAGQRATLPELRADRPGSEMAHVVVERLARPRLADLLQCSGDCAVQCSALARQQIAI